MIEIAYILMTFLLPLAIGYLLTLYLTRNNPLPRTFCLAIGYSLGTGFLTQWMLLLGVLNIPLSATKINTPLLIPSDDITP
ncbi:MAG: hypothetical protein KAS66_11650 [Candidatus Omnitrophica bacterium]|nr:hypothetical protein [Candidatus Omnitrophota bacterium]